ncbi:MAG: nucleotidyltransferase domain-containing protein [Anaerolineae bacterium]|jgi:Arc/MetJ-type ribon-helix-helix transcriptional regulator
MATKVMVSFPEEFLAEVDRVAREEHRSRSELVREALRLYMSQHHDPGQAVAAARVREAPTEAYQTLADRDRRIAREFRQRLAEITPIRDLVVFGSRARGDAAPDSDMDVFIELEEATPELRERISEIAWEVGFERDRVITTIVATRDDLEHGALGASPLVLNIEREGVRP